MPFLTLIILSVLPPIYAKLDFPEDKKERVDNLDTPNVASQHPVEEFIQEAIHSTPSFTAPSTSIGDTSLKKSLT